VGAFVFKYPKLYVCSLNTINASKINKYKIPLKFWNIKDRETIPIISIKGEKNVKYLIILYGSNTTNGL
jgi:hypothetical protein